MSTLRIEFARKSITVGAYERGLAMHHQDLAALIAANYIGHEGARILAELAAEGVLTREEGREEINKAVDAAKMLTPDEAATMTNWLRDHYDETHGGHDES